MIFKPIEVLENVKTCKFTVFRRVPDITDGQNYDIKEIAKNNKFRLLLPLLSRKKNSVGLQNIQMYCFDPSEQLYKPTAFLGNIFMANFKFEKFCPKTHEKKM
jgi:hypothetical protein